MRKRTEELNWLKRQLQLNDANFDTENGGNVHTSGYYNISVSWEVDRTESQRVPSASTFNGANRPVIGRHWHNGYDTSSDVDARTSISNESGAN